MDCEQRVGDTIGCRSGIGRSDIGAESSGERASQGEVLGNHHRWEMPMSVVYEYTATMGLLVRFGVSISTPKLSNLMESTCCHGLFLWCLSGRRNHCDCAGHCHSSADCLDSQLDRQTEGGFAQVGWHEGSAVCSFHIRVVRNSEMSRYMHSRSDHICDL